MNPSRKMGATDKLKQDKIRGGRNALDHFKSLMQTSTTESFAKRDRPSAVTSASSDVTETTSVPSSSVPSTSASASETTGILRKSVGEGAKDRGRSISLAGVPGLDPADDMLSHHHHHHHHHHSSKGRSQSFASDLSAEDHPRARAKSIIMLGSKQIAVLMEDPPSTSDATTTGMDSASSPPVVSIMPRKSRKTKGFKVPKSLLDGNVTAASSVVGEDGKRLSDKSKRGLRTFRIWAPNENRKSITIRVDETGEKEKDKDAEKIFHATQIRHKSYGQWKKEAKAQLPSVTGGPPVMSVTELINATPALQKEENPRLVQKAIRRLSLEEDKKIKIVNVAKPAPEKKKVDYTKVREINVPQPPPPKAPSPPVPPPVVKIPEPEPKKQVAPHPPPPKATAPKKVPPPPPPVKVPVPQPKPPPPSAPVPAPKAPPPPAPVVPVKKESSSEEADEDEEESSSGSYDEIPDYFIIEVEETDDEERRLEKERHQAGIEIKNKIKNLRELADHLSSKRKVRQGLIENATGFALLDTEQIPIKEQILYLIEESTDLLRDGIEKVKIWQNGIKEINGRYGVVISSYFVWLRQMVAVELFAFTVVVLVIIIPQALEQTEDPPPIVQHRPNFHLTNLLNGEGWLHYSFLYYSGYHSRNEDDPNPFNNPAFRFIFCMLFMFFVFTYFIFSRLTRYYQSVRMESKVSGVAHMEHFKSIICGWDYSCRDPEAKIYLHKTILREMRFLLTTTKTGTTLVHLELEQKPLLKWAVNKLGLFWGPWAIHILANLLLLVACIILGFLLVYLCKLKFFYYVTCVSNRDDNINRTLHHSILCPDGDPYLSTWILSLPALFASMTTLLLTHLILLVGDYETWNNPQRKIYAAMIRSGLFYFTNLFVFYLFWIGMKPGLITAGFVPETIFGKELYRLVVIQGIMDVVLNFGVKFAYHIIQKKRKKGKYKMTEFRIEYCSLSMFFIHSVSRIGTLFCPPLSIFVTLRLVLDYYQNRYALLHMSSQESYNAHASQVYAPFLLTFFILCYLITSFMNVYYIADTVPSTYNGPFVKYNSSYDEVLGILLKSEEGTNWIRHFANPAFLLVFNAILVGTVYFFIRLARTYEPLMEHLNELINLERADRDILLKAIFEVGQVEDNKKGPKKVQTSMVLQVMSSIEVSEDEGRGGSGGVGPAGDKKNSGGGGGGRGSGSSRKVDAREVDKKITEVMAKFHGSKVTDTRKSKQVLNLATSSTSQKNKEQAPPVKPGDTVKSEAPSASTATAPGKIEDESHPITELVHLPREPRQSIAALQSKIDEHKQNLSELSIASSRRNSVWKSWGGSGSGSKTNVITQMPSHPVSTTATDLQPAGAKKVGMGSKPVAQQNVFPVDPKNNIRPAVSQTNIRPTASKQIFPGIHKSNIVPAQKSGGAGPAGASKPMTSNEIKNLRYSVIKRHNIPAGEPTPGNVDDHINDVVDGIKHRRAETGNTLQGEAPKRKSIFGATAGAPKVKIEDKRKTIVKFAEDKKKKDKLNSIMGNILNKRSEVMKGMRHEVPVHNAATTKSTSRTTASTGQSTSTASTISLARPAVKQKTTKAPTLTTQLSQLNVVKGAQQMKGSPGKGGLNRK